jgi:cytoskeletal protein CcmA (bactofilin family)
MSFSFRKTSTNFSAAATKPINQDGNQKLGTMTLDDLVVLESAIFENSLTSKVYNLDKVDPTVVAENDQIALYASNEDHKLHIVSEGKDTVLGLGFDQSLNKTDDVVFAETTINGDVSIMGVPGYKTQAVIGAQQTGSSFGPSTTVGWSFIPSVDINVRVFKILALQWTSASTEKDMAIFRYSDGEIIGSKVSMTKENLVDGYYTKAVDNFTLYAGVKYIIAAYVLSADNIAINDDTYEHAEEIESVSLEIFLYGDMEEFSMPDYDFEYPGTSHFPNFDFGPSPITRNLTVEGDGTFDGVLKTNSSLIVDGSAILQDTTISDNLTVDGEGTIGSTLDVTGATTLGDDLTVDGTGAFTGTLDVDGATTIGANLTVEGTGTFSGVLDITGPTTIIDTLTVGGTGTFTGDLTANSDLIATGNTILGNTRIDSSNLTVEGTGTFEGTLDVDGITTLGDDLTVDGTGAFTGTLDVDGITTLGGNLTVGANLTATGDLNVNNGLATLKDGVIENNLAVENDLRINGTGTFYITNGLATLRNTLIRGNLTTENNLTVDGTGTFESSLDVTGITTIGGNLDVLTGTTTLNNLNVIPGATTLRTTLIKGNLTAENNLTVEGTSTFEGTLDVDGITTLGDDLTVDGTGAFTGTLDVDGITTLGGNLTVGANLTATGDLNVNNGLATLKDGVIENNLAVENDLRINGTGTFYITNGLATLRNTLIRGNLTTENNLTVDGTGTFESSLDVTGITTLGGNLDVLTGTTTLNNLNVIPGATTLSTLTVGGATTIGGNLNVTSGATSLGGNLTVGGNSTFSGHLSILKSTGISDDLTIGGDSTIGGSLDVTGATAIYSTLWVGGATTTIGGNLNITSGNNLTVGGTGTFESTLDVTGITTLEDNLTVDGTGSFTGTLNVTGVTTLDDLTVGGTGTFQSTLDVIGITTLDDLTVGGNTNLNGSLSINTPGDSFININRVGLSNESAITYYTDDNAIYRVGQLQLSEDYVIRNENTGTNVLAINKATDRITIKSDVDLYKEPYVLEDIKQALIGDQGGGSVFTTNKTTGWEFIPSISINVTSFKVSSIQWVGGATTKEIGIFRNSDQQLMGPGIFTMNKLNEIGNYYVQDVANFTLYAGVKYIIAAVYGSGDVTEFTSYTLSDEITNVFNRNSSTTSSSLLFPDNDFSPDNRVVLCNFDYDLKTTKNLTVGGTGKFESNLNVTGDTTLGNNLTVSGDSAVTGTLNVTGDTTIGNNLTVSGDTNLNGSLSCNTDSDKFTLPLNTGSDNQVLTTNGAGSTVFANSQLKAQFVSTANRSCNSSTIVSLYTLGQGSMSYADITGSAKTFTMAGEYTHTSSNTLNIFLNNGIGNEFLQWNINVEGDSSAFQPYKITINQTVHSGYNYFLCTFRTGVHLENSSMTYFQRSTNLSGNFIHNLEASWDSPGSNIVQNLLTVVHDNLM